VIFFWDIEYFCSQEVRSAMASAIIATIRSRNNRKLAEEEADGELLLENLISKLPPAETWDTELNIGVLIVG
jgi:hypothetical protein